MKRIISTIALAAVVMTMAAGISAKEKDWVTTWATALQIAEPHNCPPTPYLADNSFRQILQVSIAGKELRLHLSNYFNTDETEIKGVEIAVAKTMGASPEIDESTSVSLTFGGQKSVTTPFLPPTTAMALSFRSPASTAWKIAFWCCPSIAPIWSP